MSLGGDVTLPLSPLGGGIHETPEFVIVDPAAPASWSVPYQRVWLPGDETEVSYNPAKKVKIPRPRMRNMLPAAFPPGVNVLGPESDKMGRS